MSFHIPAEYHLVADSFQQTPGFVSLAEHLHEYESAQQRGGLGGRYRLDQILEDISLSREWDEYSTNSQPEVRQWGREVVLDGSFIRSVGGDGKVLCSVLSLIDLGLLELRLAQQEGALEALRQQYPWVMVTYYDGVSGTYRNVQESAMNKFFFAKKDLEDYDLGGGKEKWGLHTKSYFASLLRDGASVSQIEGSGYENALLMDQGDMKTAMELLASKSISQNPRFRGILHKLGGRLDLNHFERGLRLPERYVLAEGSYNKEDVPAEQKRNIQGILSMEQTMGVREKLQRSKGGANSWTLFEDGRAICHGDQEKVVHESCGHNPQFLMRWGHGIDLEGGMRR